MKKVLLALLIITILAVIGLGVFIATFDINTYKGALISQVEAAVGGRVEIERLSLAWKGRVVLGVKGFRMFAVDNGAQVSVLSFDRAEAGVELMPLLRGRFRISSVSLDGFQSYLVRSADGKIAIHGYSKPPASPAAKTVGAPAALSVNISAVSIRNGTVRFVDMMGREPSEITIRKLDADIGNVSLATPIKFSVKMAVASDKQDIAFSGTVGGLLTGNIFLRDFRMEADFAAFGHSEILKAFPAIGKTGLKEGLAGRLTVNIRELTMEKDRIAKLSGNLSISGGRVILAQIRAPIEDISLEAVFEGSTLTLTSFAARVVNGVLRGGARIDDYLESPRTSLRLTAEARGFSEFLSTVAAVRQNLDGNAKITFEGSMSGSSWPEMSKTLSGKGTFVLDNGIIINANVMDQTMGALTVFPNLVNSVQGKVSQPEQQALTESFTVLKPLNQAFMIEGGYIIVPDLILQSEYADMRGDAKMSLTGDISGSGMIRFASSVSGAMVMAVPQIKAITDAQGNVTFPISFKGGSGTFKVIPDTKYIGRKIAIDTAGDVVSGYLKKAGVTQDEAAKAAGAGVSAESGASKKPPKLKDILKAIADEAEKNN